MPSQLTHLKVAQNIKRKIKKLNLCDYYAGVLAPDAVNLNGFAEKEIRYKSHLRDANLDIWQNNILLFYKQNKNKISKSYLFGFLIHVLTDIEFDRFYPEYQNNHNHLNKDKIWDLYCLQIRQYENTQLNKLWFKNVKSKLACSTCYNVNNIETKQIYGYINKTLTDYNNKEKSNNQGQITNKTVKQISKNIYEVLIKENII